MTGEHPFAGRQTRVLAMEDVRKLLDVDTAIEIQRAAFLSLARGHTTAAPNAWLRLPAEQRGWLKLLAGYDAVGGGLAVKVLARFPNNPPGANLGSLLLLFDPDNGFPLAVMDGVYITAVRTGAGAGVATGALSGTGATRVGLIGTGVVAWYSLLAMSRTRPELDYVNVYSRSESRRAQFAERLRAELELDASPVTSVAAAVTDVDIIVTATNSPEPLLYPDHLSPGLMVNAMGIRTEIAPEAVAQCVVIGDGREETLHDGKFSVALEAGAVRESDLGPDLGQVLDGAEVPGSPEERVTMFDSSGVAIQDVASARFVWERAEELNLGTLVDLGLTNSP